MEEDLSLFSVFERFFIQNNTKRKMLSATFIEIQMRIEENSEIPRKNEFLDNHVVNSTLTRSCGCIQ